MSKVDSYSGRNRRKPLQEFFKYFKHAEKCQREELKDPILDSYDMKRCKSTLCNYVDMVISHKTLLNCQSSKNCNISGCYSSAKLFLHCKECTTSDCYICLLIKKKNNSIGQENGIAEKVTSSDLDNKCGVYFEEKCMQTDPCENTRTATTQTDESIFNDLFRKVDFEKADVCKSACFPGGLILETVDTEPYEKKDLILVRRMLQVHGFIKTIIGKSDISTILNKKLFNFFAYITYIEKEVHRNTNSKEEYLKLLVKKILETNDRFKDYKENNKTLSKEDAAESCFREKIIETFAYEVKEMMFPGGLVLKLGEPKITLEKGQKRWQKSLTPSERDSSISKLTVKYFTDTLKKRVPFAPIIFSEVHNCCEAEETIYMMSQSKADYYDMIHSLERNKPKKSVNSETEDKKHLENYINITKQFPEREILINEKGEDKEDEKVPCPFTSNFCYSHNLLLTYSVTYQLWKKSKEESSEKTSDSK